MSLTLPLQFTGRFPNVPSGYTLRTVRPWSDEIMQSYGYSVTRGSGRAIGQFQVVQLYVLGLAQGADGESWVGTWSAISNYNKLSHADLMKIANMQLLEFKYPYPMTESQLIAMKDMPLPDGYSLNAKMGWLYHDGIGTVFWGDGADWWTTPEARFGTMVFGGQQVAVGMDARVFQVIMPERSAKTPVIMRQVLTFRPSDFGKSHADSPWLCPWSTVANIGDTYGENIKGHVLCPAPLHPAFFDFAGTFSPSSYWIPEEWLR